MAMTPGPKRSLSYRDSRFATYAAQVGAERLVQTPAPREAWRPSCVQRRWALTSTARRCRSIQAPTRGRRRRGRLGASLLPDHHRVLAVAGLGDAVAASPPDSCCPRLEASAGHKNNPDGQVRSARCRAVRYGVSGPSMVRSKSVA
jgi:hypothetical protein